MARPRSNERPKARAKAMPEKPLSPAEWRIMQSCWKLGRTTIRDILLDIADRPPAMSYSMIHMLLTRIVEKGYLALEQDRGNNYYAAAVERDSIVRLAAEDFIDNTLAGEAKNLEILNEVLAERKAARPRGRKAT